MKKPIHVKTPEYLNCLSKSSLKVAFVDEHLQEPTVEADEPTFLFPIFPKTLTKILKSENPTNLHDRMVDYNVVALRKWLKARDYHLTDEQIEELYSYAMNKHSKSLFYNIPGEVKINDQLCRLSLKLGVFNGYIETEEQWKTIGSNNSMVIKTENSLENTNITLESTLKFIPPDLVQQTFTVEEVLTEEGFKLWETIGKEISKVKQFTLNAEQKFIIEQVLNDAEYLFQTVSKVKNLGREYDNELVLDTLTKLNQQVADIADELAVLYTGNLYRQNQVVNKRIQPDGFKFN